MLRKPKKFSLPRQLFDKPRILEENKLVEKYGLKNKREIWKTEAKVKYFRDRAKSLITADPEDQNVFFKNLNKIGLNVKSISDVLALNKEDLLKRRLSSFMVKKNLANTPKHARQLIVHKKVMIDGKVVNVPGYIVRIDEENNISLRVKERKPKPAPVAEKSEDSESAEVDEGKVESKEAEAKEEK